MNIYCVLLIFVARMSRQSFLHQSMDDNDETEVSDWSEAVTDGQTRVINLMIGFDSPLTRHYNYDQERIKAATVTLMHTTNQYLYPVGIRLAVVDILPVKGNRMGLDDFIAWKREQDSLVKHDVAILLRHNYEGGIAYSNGICTKNNLLISGFFPGSTMNNAALLIHQLAHVFGVTHQMRTNCQCRKTEQRKCLKMRGYAPCSVQTMVDMIANHTCLNSNEDKLTELARKSLLPVCGNGIVENGEECDCGPEKFCDNAICEPQHCRLVVNRETISTIITLCAAVLCSVAIIWTWKVVSMVLRKFIRKRRCVTKNSMEIINNELSKVEEGKNEENEMVAKQPVKMRSNTVEATRIQRLSTRLSDLYVPMRPISRFWEKIRQQKNEAQDL